MGYGIKIFVPRPLHYVTSSPGKQTWIFRSMVSQKKRICGNAGCTKYRGKISPRAMDSGYVACISKEAKNPTCTMFLLIFLWQNPIQDRHPNHGERSFYTGLQHLVKRHRLLCLKESLEHDLPIFKFGLRWFKDSDKDMSYYPVLTYGQFVALFKVPMK